MISLPLRRSTHLATHVLQFSSTLSVASSFFGITRRLSCSALRYAVEEHGSCFTTDYSLYFKNESGLISPFHDIPLLADKENNIYNMVVEIPKWTNAKMEISTKDKMNPIKQDMKKGKVRFVQNSFPYKGYIWNYGAIPQTWEDPTLIDEHTGQKGDGDPIDVIEIGNKVSAMGEVKQIKLLGIMALIDEGETDWKVIAIDINDPLASHLNEVKDIYDHMPGLVEATYDWFRNYKIPGGSPPNNFAFSGEVKNSEFTNKIIIETHEQWRKLVQNEIENKGLACENVSVEKSPYKIDHEEANKVTENLPGSAAPTPVPDDVDKMYYISDKQRGY